MGLYCLVSWLVVLFFEGSYVSQAGLELALTKVDLELLTLSALPPRCQNLPSEPPCLV